MKKVIKTMLAFAALMLCGGAWADVQLKWSNTATQLNGGDAAWATWKIRVPASAAVPNGSQVSIESIKIANRSNDTYAAPAWKITVGDKAYYSRAYYTESNFAINAKSTPDTRNASVYKFDEPAVLTVGTEYTMKAVNASTHAELADQNNGGATGVQSAPDDWILKWDNSTVASYRPVVEVRGKIAGSEKMLYCYHLDGNATNSGTAGSDNVTTGSSQTWNSTSGVGGSQSLTSIKNSYVKVLNTTNGIASFEQGWTVSFWINAAEDTSWANHGVLHIGDKYYQLQHAGSNKKVNIYPEDTAVASQYTGIALPSYGVWHHIALVSSGEGFKIYLNGVFDHDYQPLEGKHLYGEDSQFHGLTGFCAGDDPENLRGGSTSVDEVAIFNFAANQDQILALAAGVPGNDVIAAPNDVIDSAAEALLAGSNNDMLIHLDASDDANFEFDEDGLVAKWKDLSDNQRDATPSATYPNSVTKKGRVEVVNGCRSFQMGEAGSGIDLAYTRMTGIRTVFWVMDIANSEKAFFLGDTGTGSTYNFHRGTSSQFAYDQGDCVLGNEKTKVYCDGLDQVNKRNAKPVPGHHIYSAVLNANSQSNCLSQDRDQTNRNGGRAISELIAFYRALNDNERRIIENYLMRKWIPQKDCKTDSLSIKLGTRCDNGNGFYSYVYPTDGLVGAYPAMGKYWNYAPAQQKNSGTYNKQIHLVDGKGLPTSTKVTLWARNDWYNSKTDASIGNANVRMTRSFVDYNMDSDTVAANTSKDLSFDDKTYTLPAASYARCWQIRVDDIPYRKYDVYVIVASGESNNNYNNTYSPVAIKVGEGEWAYYRGNNKTTAVATGNNQTWTGRRYSVYGEMIEGENYLKVRVAASNDDDDVSTLHITHGGSSLAIAALQIVNAENAQDTKVLTVPAGTEAVLSAAEIVGYSSIVNNGSLKIEAPKNSSFRVPATITGDTSSIGVAGGGMAIITKDVPTNGSLTITEGKLMIQTSGQQKLEGNIVVEDGAGFVSGLNTDGLKYGSGVKPWNVYGELDMGYSRWTISGNNTLNFYPGAIIKGLGQFDNSGNGAFDIYQATTLNFKAKDGVGGVVKYDVSTRLRNANATFNVDEGVVVDVTGKINNGAVSTLYKTGDGVLKFETGSILAHNLQINAGHLDLSAVAGTSAAAIITKNLTISAGTILHFPEELAAGSAYTLCTGTLTATNGSAEIYVGKKRYKGATLTYDTSAKTVSYTLPATSYTLTADENASAEALNYGCGMVINGTSNYADDAEIMNLPDGCKAYTDGSSKIRIIKITTDAAIEAKLNQAALHFDASVLSSVTVDGEGNVTSWANLGADSTRANAKLTGNGNSANVSPVLTTSAEGVYLDFGDGDSHKDLGWRRLENIKTVIQVVDLVHDGNKGFFLGDWNNGQGTYGFHRGDNAEYLNTSYCKADYVYDNGVSKERGADCPTGMRVLSMGETGSDNIASDCFSHDRNQETRNGGRKLCETVVFTTALSDSERAEIEDYLLRKWFNAKAVVNGVPKTSIQEALNAVEDGDYTTVHTLVTPTAEEIPEGWFAKNGSYAPIYAKIGEEVFSSFGEAVVKATEMRSSGEKSVTITLSRNVAATGENILDGVIIDLNGNELTGSLNLKSGAYILEGTGEDKKVKIDGFATSIDVTYGSGSINSCLKYSAFGGLSECNGNSPVYTTDADAIMLNKNPWLKNVNTFFTSTEQISFATAGIMPKANKTIFAHMGSKNSWGLFLATGTNNTDVVIGYNEGLTPHEITTINVPNARTHRHTYIITKNDNMSSTPTKTTFVIYLDGIKWKTFEHTPRFEITGGFQVGSTFEGIINDFKAVGNTSGVTEDVAYVNFMRAYNRIISSEEIKAYTDAYPYTSPNGTYKRSVTADGDWVSQNAWNGNAEKPTTNGNVELSIDSEGDTAVTIDVNLTEAVEYEKLTIKSESGKAVKLSRTDTNAKPIKAVCTVIGTPVILGEGAVDLKAGPTIILDSGSLTFDFSGLRIAAGEIFEEVLTGDIDETDAVKVIKPTDTSFYFGLVYENNHYKAVAHDLYQYWPTKSQYVWASATDTEEGFQLNKNQCIDDNGTTKVIDAAKELIFDTDHWNNDNTLYLKGIVNPKIRVCEGVVLKVGHSGGDECNLNGGTITIEDGAEVQLAYNNGNDDGSAVLKGTVTFNKVGDAGTGFVSIRANDLTVPIAGIAGTAPLSGNGHVIIDGNDATITTDPTIKLGSGWTGTVELKNFTKNTSSNFGVLDLNKYGQAGSTLAMNGVTTTPYAVGNSGNTPAIVIGDLEIKEGGWKLHYGTLTSDDHYTANLKGSGTIQVSGFGNGNCQVVFKGDHSQFTGSVTDVDDGEYSSTSNHQKTKRIAFIGPSASFPGANQEYGTIYVDQTSTMKLTSATTWTATNGIKVFGTLDLTSDGTPTFVGAPSFGSDVAVKLATMPGDEAVKIINGEFTEAAEPLTLGLKIMVGAEIDRTHMITLKADGVYIEKNNTGRIQSLIVGSGENRTLTVGTTLSCIAPPSLNAEGTITVDVAGLEAGAYDLVTWTGVLSRGHVGYGKPHVAIQNVPQGWEGKLVFQATKISLLLRDPEWLARKPLTIWPFGDSITEGYNNSNKANYRIQLFQKLELLGYNVKSVGWWTSNHDGQYSGCQSYDPTGTICQREDWSYHSGVRSARVMWENGSNNVLCDAVETGLDQAGDPDVVLLHIGTNDGASGATWQQVYDGITNVAWRIVAARENTKVVMSTILPLADNRDLNTTHIAKINQALKDAIAANVFPEGRVYLADLWSYVPTMGNGHSPVQNYVSDDTHPDWIGHDKMANGWLDTITQIFTNKEDPRIQSNIVRTAPTADHQGAAANVPAEYRKGYRKLATMKPGAETHFAKNADAYTSTESGVDGDTTLSNVAYYMELINKETKIHRFVWVDMAAFDGAKFSACGFPTAANKQMVVQNLHVYANTGAIENVDPSDNTKTGFIEFSPYNYGSGKGTVDGAPNNAHGYDWSDTLQTNGGYGCFQIHRISPSAPRVTDQPAQILFAYNKWGDANSGVTEIGIGNFSQYSPSNMDYTGTAGHKNIDASAYEVINIEFWGKVPGCVVPDGSEVEVAEAATEEEALADLTIATVSEADAAANAGADNELGQAQYLTLQATRVGSSNNWKVQAVVDNAKLPENKKIDDTAVAFANAGGIMKLAGATEKQTISIPKDKATAGLYYSVSFGTTPDNHTQESERILATSGVGTVDIPVPALGNEKVYYIKVKASATK